MEKFKVGIVIPAFNEELTITQVVNSVKHYGTAIVVNDASKDRTKQKAEDSGAVVVNHKENKGYDCALNTGFQKASELSCDAVVTFDADGQHDAETIKEYIYLLKNKCDVVVGIRPYPARLSEHISKKLLNFFFGIKDPLCGVKGYRMKVYRKRGYFDSYNSIGTELSIYAKVNGYVVRQVDVSIKDRTDSPRFGSLISANWKIIRSVIIGILKYSLFNNLDNKKA
jgi:glycosyltransferase involved in cell wall biosynthesis